MERVREGTLTAHDVHPKAEMGSAWLNAAASSSPPPRRGGEAGGFLGGASCIASTARAWVRRVFLISSSQFYHPCSYTFVVPAFFSCDL